MILTSLLSMLMPLTASAAVLPQVRVYNPGRYSATRMTSSWAATNRAVVRYCREHPRAAKCRRPQPRRHRR